MQLPSKPSPNDFIPQKRELLVFTISPVLDKCCTVKQVQGWP